MGKKEKGQNYIQKVLVKYDIPHRRTDEGTWLEAGEYYLRRILENGKLLIVIREDDYGRILTVVRQEEVIFL